VLPRNLRRWSASWFFAGRVSRFDGSFREPTMIFDPLFGLLLGAEFADAMLAPVGPCDLHAPNALCLHWR
jgi:hypothetical protein